MNPLPSMPFADWLALLMFLSAFVSIMVSIALVAYNPTHRHANRLLSLSLLSFSLYAIVSGLLINHAILLVPHAFRSASPLQYLAPPCAYLYVRSVLYRENKLRPYDWLHFIPFALHTLELMPFLLQSSAYKLNYLQRLLMDLQGVIKLEEGVLPAYFHPVLKFIWGSGYVLLQGRLVWRFRLKVPRPLMQSDYTLLEWLKTFTLLNGLLYLPVLLSMFLPVNPDILVIFALFTLGGHLLLCATLLFFRPQVLYGLAIIPPSDRMEKPVPATAALENIAREEAAKVYSLSPEKKREYGQMIEDYIGRHQVFLRKGYSIKELAAETAIPQHHVSAVINQVYRMNFSDFINRYRVEFVKEKLKQPEWRQLTLEGIALAAGFTNRITFFRAFTKLTGITPSEFIAQYTPLN